jgi:hypothetical protein
MVMTGLPESPLLAGVPHLVHLMTSSIFLDTDLQNRYRQDLHILILPASLESYLG